MNNRNLGVMVAVIAVAAGAIGFAVMNNDKAAKETVVSSVTAPAAIEPAAGPTSTPAPTAAATPAADNPVVAKVDGQNILRSDVVAFAKNFPPQLQQLPAEQLFPIAVEQTVAAKIVDMKASKEKDLSTDPEVAKREADAKVQIVRTVYLEKEVEKRLTDDRIQKAYDKFKADQEKNKTEEVHARHILVDSEDKAKDLIKQLQNGAKFEDLAKANSKDTANKDKAGDLGYFTKDAMVKEFADVAFSMNTGDVSKTPVKTQFGWHVIQVIDKRTRPIPTLEEIKPQIAAEERRQILNEIVEEWRKKADVETFDINGKPLPKKTEAPAKAPEKTDAPASK